MWNGRRTIWAQLRSLRGLATQCDCAAVGEQWAANNRQCCDTSQEHTFCSVQVPALCEVLCLSERGRCSKRLDKESETCPGATVSPFGRHRTTPGEIATCNVLESRSECLRDLKLLLSRHMHTCKQASGGASRLLVRAAHRWAPCFLATLSDHQP